MHIAVHPLFNTNQIFLSYQPFTAEGNISSIISLEVHFMELPKLFNDEVEKNENDPIVQWMEFIDGKSEGVMKMLAQKNEKIKKAYNLLQIISKDGRQGWFMRQEKQNSVISLQE